MLGALYGAEPLDVAEEREKFNSWRERLVPCITDTVAYLASIGKEVTVVTDRKEFASNVEVIHMYVLRKRFQQTDAEALSSKPFKHPVKVYQSCTIDEIKKGEVVLVDKEFNKIPLPCDNVVTCWTRPQTELLEQMKAAGLNVVKRLP